MHYYIQEAGLYCRRASVIDACLALGYSGNGPDLNNPASENIAGHGPIPKGDWKIVGVKDSAVTGPYSIILEAITYKGSRSLFRIHGDNNKYDNSASHGCVILARNFRHYIYSFNNEIFRVL